MELKKFYSIGPRIIIIRQRVKMGAFKYSKGFRIFVLFHFRLGWAGLGWAGLGWAGLGWAGLDMTVVS
jgi:hypothetical protein